MIRPGMDAGTVPRPRRRRRVAASHAARSAALFAWRVATRSASRTARPRSRSLAALRNAFASAATEIVGAGEPGGRARARGRRAPTAGPSTRHRVAVGGRLVQPRAEDEDRIGGVEPLPDRRRGAEPGHAEVQRMVVRDDVGAAPGRDDRDLEELGEAGQLRRRPRAQDTRAGEDHGPAGAGQQLDDGADLLVGRARRRSTGPRRASVVGHRSRRADPRAGTGGPARAGRRAPGGPPRPWPPATSSAACGSTAHLASAAERRDLVDLLEGLATEERALDLADDARTSGSSPGARCGCRSRGWRHRRPASRGRPPGARSAGRGPRP